MTVDFKGIRDVLISHALTTGWFDNVSGHEPKSAPGKGVHGALWTAELGPVAEASGLAATSLRIAYSFRVYRNMLAEPQDDIDPDVCAATTAFMANVHADYTLGGLVRNVDLLGAHGSDMDAQAGYLDQDGLKYRVMVVSLAVIINDEFPQEA